MKLTTYDADNINTMRDIVYKYNLEQGWHDTPRNIELFLRTNRQPELADAFNAYHEAALLALIHSEVSEALEGRRKDLMDDHLPHRPMAEVELADVFIRLLDLAGSRGYDLGGAVYEKFLYNMNRKDHKKEERAKPQGKKF